MTQIFYSAVMVLGIIISFIGMIIFLLFSDKWEAATLTVMFGFALVTLFRALATKPD
jgi:hypothetical protein